MGSPFGIYFVIIIISIVHIVYICLMPEKRDSSMHHRASLPHRASRRTILRYPAMSAKRMRVILDDDFKFVKHVSNTSIT